MVSIRISSENFSGETAEVVFTPDNNSGVINLGLIDIPFDFEPYLLIPPQEIYGTYVIKSINGDCTNVLRVPRPTPTPTPTPSVTPTNTPTPTPSVTPTSTSDPCKVTPTPTPSVSHSGYITTTTTNYYFTTTTTTINP